MLTFAKFGFLGDTTQEIVATALSRVVHLEGEANPSSLLSLLTADGLTRIAAELGEILGLSGAHTLAAADKWPVVVNGAWYRDSWRVQAALPFILRAKSTATRTYYFDMMNWDGAAGSKLVYVGAKYLFSLWEQMYPLARTDDALQVAAFREELWSGNPAKAVPITIAPAPLPEGWGSIVFRSSLPHLMSTHQVRQLVDPSLNNGDPMFREKLSRYHLSSETELAELRADFYLDDVDHCWEFILKVKHLFSQFFPPCLEILKREYILARIFGDHGGDNDFPAKLNHSVWTMMFQDDYIPSDEKTRDHLFNLCVAKYGDDRTPAPECPDRPIPGACR